MLRYMTGADHRQEARVFRAVFAKMDVAGAEATVRAHAAASSPRWPPRRSATRRRVRARCVPPLARRRDRPPVPRHRARRRAHGDDLAAAAAARVPPRRRTRLAARHAGRRDRLAEVVREIAREAAAGSPSVAGGTALSLLAASDDSALESPARVENFVMIFRIASNDLTGLLDWIFRFLATHRNGAKPCAPTAGPPAGPRPRRRSTPRPAS
ncbi:MAG: hypothetical protein IPG84_12325 [Betaproteobacteria bacterium]|nr:hypothetical protein [Betaproteobacteria bacterium]